MLEFNAETHEYRIDGRLVPSVTQVINAVLPGWQAGEWYMRRGTALHHGCRFLDEGRLDWSSVSPEIEPRIKAWAKFRDEFPAEVLACELPLGHVIGFAGTLDRVLRQAEASDGIICDIKSTITPQVRLQLAAYRLLWAGQTATGATWANGHVKINRGVAVELRDDGTYSTLWMNADELSRCEQVFLACLSVYGFAAKHKIKLQGDDR